MSLFINKKLLEQYNACEVGLKYMERFYPQGASSIQLLRDRHIPERFLHWGFRYLPADADDLAAYEERFELTKCRAYYDSKRCENSNNLINSEDVSGSSFIFSTQGAKNCDYVIGCNNVEGCSNVYNSVNLKNCGDIYGGTSLTNCRCCYLASYSKESKGLFNCDFCFNSRNLINCKQMESCEFCSDCSGLKNCLFCFGLTEGENLIFNKPAPASVIEMAKAEFDRFGGMLLNISDDWRPPYLNISPRINLDLREQFMYFTQDYWTFVSRLPNYDPQILYNITLMGFLLTPTE